MLDVAIPKNMRANSDVVRLRRAASGGDAVALEQLFDLLHQRIRLVGGMDIKGLLRASKGDESAARDWIYAVFVVEMNHLKTVARNDTRGWDDLETTLLSAAELLWRDQFLTVAADAEVKKKMRDRSSGERAGFLQVAAISRLLMFLWLENRIFRHRAFINQVGIQLEANGNPKTALQRKIRELVHKYRAALVSWDAELKPLAKTSIFVGPGADFQRFRTLSREAIEIQPEEAGWASLAEDAHEELRYQLFDERRREYTRRWKMPAAIAYAVLRVTTGYGMKPARFAWTVVLTIFGFAALFFLNDYFNPGLGSSQHFCAESGAVDQSPWWAIIVRYLYLSVVNLASLASNGSVAAYCDGSSTQTILILSALTGYFLLAILASLFFRLLTEAE
jgi:hypothetical protein